MSIYYWVAWVWEILWLACFLTHRVFILTKISVRLFQGFNGSGTVNFVYLTFHYDYSWICPKTPAKTVWILWLIRPLLVALINHSKIHPHINVYNNNFGHRASHISDSIPIPESSAHDSGKSLGFQTLQECYNIVLLHLDYVLAPWRSLWLLVLVGDFPFRWP